MFASLRLLLLAFFMLASVDRDPDEKLCSEWGEDKGEPVYADESTLERNTQCIEKARKVARATDRFNSLLQGIEADGDLLKSQNGAMAEAYDLLSQVQSLTRETLAFEAPNVEAGLNQLSASVRTLDQLGKKLEEMRSTWNQSIRFPAESSIWMLLSMIDDPYLPAPLKVKIRAFKKGYPPSFFGEGEADSEVLLQVDQSIALARRGFDLRRSDLNQAVINAFWRTVAEGIKPLQASLLAQEYEARIFERLKIDDLEIRVRVQLASGVVFSPADRAAEAIQVLTVALSTMPENFRPTIAGHFVDTMGRLQRLRDAGPKDAPEYAIFQLPRALEFQRDRLLAEILLCAEKYPGLGQWADAAVEKVNQILLGLKSKPVSQDHVKARHILAEQSWIELNEIRHLCRTRQSQ